MLVSRNPNDSRVCIADLAEFSKVNTHVGGRLERIGFLEIEKIKLGRHDLNCDTKFECSTTNENTVLCAKQHQVRKQVFIK